MKRRDLIKIASSTGSIAGISALTGCTTAPADDAVGGSDTDDDPSASDDSRVVAGDDGQTDEPSEPDDEHHPYSDEFETVIEATSVGADPDGEEPINFLFEEYAGDDTLFVFESGTYGFNPIQIDAKSHFGIVGTGDDRPRFVPVNEECRGGHPQLYFDGVTDLLLDNLVIDQTEVDGGGGIHMFVNGDSTVKNVAYRGNCPNQISVIRLEVRDSAGSAVFENFEATNDGHDNEITGVYVGANHAGVLTFQDCHLSEYADNGLYASAPGGSGGANGPVHVVGGRYENNNIAGIRLGSTGSTVDSATVVVDSETPGWGGLNARGIRLRYGSDHLIEDSEIIFGEDAADSFGALVFHHDNNGATVRNTAVTLHRDSVPAIRAFSASNPGAARLTFEDVTVTGTASDGMTANIVGRDETVFRGCHFEQTGNNRSGLSFTDSHDCRIVNSYIDVGIRPVELSNASVRIEDSTLVTPDGEREITDEKFEDEIVGPN